MEFSYWVGFREFKDVDPSFRYSSRLLPSYDLAKPPEDDQWWDVE